MTNKIGDKPQADPNRHDDDHGRGGMHAPGRDASDHGRRSHGSSADERPVSRIFEDPDVTHNVVGPRHTD